MTVTNKTVQENTQTKHNLKSKQRKIQQNKTTLFSRLLTLGHEMRQAYSTTIRSPNGAPDGQQPCVSDWPNTLTTCERKLSGTELVLSVKFYFQKEPESPAIADKPARRESLPKIAPIRRAYNVVADSTGLSSFV